MVLGVDETLPQIVFEPTLLRVDSLVHRIFAFRKETSHMISNVAICSGKVKVEGENVLHLKFPFNLFQV
jgi:hypothetical protein